jgi:hypothetical protein
MNFNIYVDKETGERLARMAKRRRTSRNALIREALQHFVAQGPGAQWPGEVLGFQGVRKVRPFEAARRKLVPPSADPLA